MKPEGKFNLNGKKQRPEKPKGWKEYKEPKQKVMAAARTEEIENSDTENLNSSGATDDETGVQVGNEL